jgi:uncharacterized membrane protein
MLMKTNIVSGSTIAVAAVALVLVGAAPAAAKHHHHHKQHAEKHKCNAKDGCAAKKDDKAAPAPAAPAPAGPAGGAK